MKHQQKAWLVAYDIRQPRRLRRVHRVLRKEGAPDTVRRRWQVCA